MPVRSPPLTLDQFTTFGELLKFLRRRARLTQRDLSIAVGYSEAQISHLEKNHRLPDPTTIAARFVPALDLEHDPAAATRLLALATNARLEAEPQPGDPPFLGLRYFDKADANLFFGREKIIAQLVYALSQERFLALVGASGSGKSSVVRAGLVPAMLACGWSATVITPTAHPAHTLARVDNSLSQSTRAGPPLLVVDQFEELFTLCHHEAERRSFIGELVALAETAATVVIALRADFYAHCAPYDDLRERLAHHQEYLGPMNQEELRRAIEEPARRTGWEFETGLVDLMLNEIAGEPGALPLLSHALIETWERRRGRTCTFAGYRASGGVRRAISETAETVYADQLDPQEQQIARHIFLRLTELGEGTEDTRRRVSLQELLSAGRNSADVRRVLTELANARLVTTSENSVEVAHEALIREWGRLRDWLSEDREGLRLHRRLTEDAQEWGLAARDPGMLYRGARLAQVQAWAAQNASALNDEERAFLTFAVQTAEREQREREEQQQRERAAAQALADSEARAARQLRRRTALLASAFLLLLLLASLAVWLGTRTLQEGQTAQAQQALMRSRVLAAKADGELETDAERSILLALQALASADTPEAQNALHRALSASRTLLHLQGHTDRVNAIAYSPDGTRLATAGWDATARVWDAVTGKQLLVLKGAQRRLTDVAFSPDGKRLATAGWDTTVRIWDSTNGVEQLKLQGHSDPVVSVVFSPDGKQIITGSWDDTVRLWDATTGRQTRIIYDYTDEIERLALSPDGRQIAGGFSSGQVHIWDAASGDLMQTLIGHQAAVTAIAYSADGKRLATSGDDQTVRVWDVPSGTELYTLRGHAGPVKSVRFSPDGRRLASASGDGTIKLWDTASRQELLTLRGHAGGANAVAFSPDCIGPPLTEFSFCGTRLASAGSDSAPRVWGVSPVGSREVFTVPGNDARYSPDGARLLVLTALGTQLDARVWELDGLSAKPGLSYTLTTAPGRISAATVTRYGVGLAAGSADGYVHLWRNVNETGAPQVIYVLDEHALSTIVRSLDFSLDGRYMATGTDDGAVRIWDSDGDLVLTLTGHTGTIQQVKFSPDGLKLVSTASDETARIWDATTGKELNRLPHSAAVSSATFSADGRLVATGDSDGTIRLWDASSGKPLQSFSRHTGAITSLDFSTDGTRLASGSGDRTAKVWDVASGRELVSFSESAQEVTRVAFSPDGARLAVASQDRLVRVYLLHTDELIALAKSRVTRALTGAECDQFLNASPCPIEP